MIKTALIIDDKLISRWQLRALEMAESEIEIDLIVNCTNTKTQKNILKNFIYYIINLFFMRGYWTKKIPLPKSFDSISVISFESDYEKNWQIIPDEIKEKLKSKNIDLAIKFGMNLLKDPDKLPLGRGVLSYHHGNPGFFRGRPAGFYELIQSAPNIGIIVQKLTNKIDGGQIFASAKSKIFDYSYKKTLNNLYSNSPSLLTKAIQNIKIGKYEENLQKGKNYPLPGNTKALLFLFKMLFNILKRILYGIFIEKKWNIAFTKYEVSKLCAANDNLELQLEEVLKIHNKYSFYADPFPFENKNLIIAEALNKFNGVGELVILSKNKKIKPQRLTTEKKHVSYPQVINDSENNYILVEVAFWSHPFFLKIDETNYNIIEKIYIKGLEDKRLVDPTYVFYKNCHYIFANLLSESLDGLHIFYSRESMFGPYKKHSLNPVIINPACSRMGGSFWFDNGKIYRIGQNNNYEYGGGLVISEILQLSTEEYSEKIVRNISVRSAYGPHTLNKFNDGFVFDFYRKKFSLFAGARRFVALIKNRI